MLENGLFLKNLINIQVQLLLNVTIMCVYTNNARKYLQKIKVKYLL